MCNVYIKVAKIMFKDKFSTPANDSIKKVLNSHESTHVSSSVDNLICDIREHQSKCIISDKILSLKVRYINLNMTYHECTRN